MKKLIKGIVDFRKNTLAEYREKFAHLAVGQSPDALLIACCDSRVAPNVFASSDPGDLLVLRNIGNLVPPYQGLSRHIDNRDRSVAAALEFALFTLHVSDIIICGHSECAAIHSLLGDEPCHNARHSFLDAWLEHALPSCKRFQSHQLPTHNLAPHNVLSRVNVLQQLEHLKTYPWIMERLEKKQLRIHGWWFDLATADVYHYDPHLGDFAVIDPTEAEAMLAALQ